MPHWQPLPYPSWHRRDRYVARINRWHLDRCLKLSLRPDQRDK
ncbi:hypothetical protein ACQ4N7_28420 [Nodosilinea sp. AN01ver1]